VTDKVGVMQHMVYGMQLLGGRQFHAVISYGPVFGVSFCGLTAHKAGFPFPVRMRSSQAFKGIFMA